MEQRQDEIPAQPRAPWWLRPPAAFALVLLLVLANRWLGGGVVVPLAVLALAASIVVLGMALLSPRLRQRWFGKRWAK